MADFDLDDLMDALKGVSAASNPDSDDDGINPDEDDDERDDRDVDDEVGEDHDGDDEEDFGSAATKNTLQCTQHSQ